MSILDAPGPSPGEERRRARPRHRHAYKGWAPYLFTSPYVILTAIFFVVPLANAIVLAFLSNQWAAQPGICRAGQLSFPV